MTKREIQKCNDLDTLKSLAIEQYKTLFYIGETLVDVSKSNITADKGIDKIREYMLNLYKEY